MKIVRYYPRAFAGDGGMTGAVHSSAEAMCGFGADVTVAFDGMGVPTPTTSGPVRYVGLRHRGAGPLKVPVGLDHVLRDADVLVLHSAWTSHNLAAAAIARRLRVPYVLEPRGAYDPHIVRRHRLAKSVWWYAAERRMLRAARGVHIFFASERPHLADLGYDGAIVTVPNGVHFRPEERWDGGSGDYLLWLGRFDPEHKGLDILLDAMGQLPVADRPALRLHGPDWHGRRADVAAMVSDRGLDASVKICPSVLGAEKRRVVARARAFIYPSRWEAFGNSVAEAAALGVPVLTTPYPLGEYLEDRGAGITASRDAAALATGITDVLSDEAAVLGGRARWIAEHEFSWDAVARSWLDQVECLL